MGDGRRAARGSSLGLVLFSCMTAAGCGGGDARGDPAAPPGGDPDAITQHVVTVDLTLSDSVLAGARPRFGYTVIQSAMQHGQTLEKGSVQLDFHLIVTNGTERDSIPVGHVGVPSDSGLTVPYATHEGDDLLLVAAGTATVVGTGGRSDVKGVSAEARSHAYVLPVTVIPVPLAAGNAFTCARSAGSPVQCWGAGGKGQLGRGLPGNATVPGPVLASTGFVRIAAGGEATCALDGAGSVYCWGSNEAGQVGDGSGLDRPEPSRLVDVPAFESISVGRWHVCALDPGGQVYCWGNNTDGEIGNGRLSGDEEPVPVVGDHRFTAVSAGTHHSCAIDTDGAAWCWGDDTFGRLGNGGDGPSVEPVRVSGGIRFSTIRAGDWHTCGLDETGRAWCWGGGANGQLGSGSTPTDAEVPVPVSGGHTFTDLSAGGLHTCGLDPSGLAWCWGDDTYGQLGDGATGISSTPVAVAGDHTFTALALGSAHTCATTPSGRTWCWGRNDFGQLGDGSGQDSPIPVEVAPGG